MSALLKYCVFLLSLAVLPLMSCGQSGNNLQLTAREFDRQLSTRPDAQLLDVRRPDEFSSGHIPGALNLNYHADDFKASTRALDRGRPVYVYCRSGGRSASAADYLRQSGFTEVYELKGGIKAWKKAGLRVKR